VNALIDLYQRHALTARWRWVFAIGLALSLLMLVTNIGFLVDFWAEALGYRYELDYGEGIVWQQMTNMLAGQGYSPLGVYPAIVYHYPPVYHLATAAMVALSGLDPLYAGRVVAIMSTALLILLTGLIACELIEREDRPVARYICGAVAALLLAACHPVIGWSAMMRVDMLGCALTAVGLLLVIRAHTSFIALLGAAVLFTLAVYTKQTFIGGPAAAFLALLLLDPKRALIFLSGCFVLGLGVLAWLMASSHGGFLTHIILYNVNRFDWAGQATARSVMKRQVVLIALGLIGAALATATLPAAWHDSLAALRERIRQSRRLFAALLMLLFLLIKTLMLPLIMKSGSNENYFVEWLFALAIFAGLAIRPLVRAVVAGEGRTPALLAALVVIGIPLQTAFVLDWHSGYKGNLIQSQTPVLDQLATRIRAARKPVISDDMVLLIRAGQPVLWEPAIEAELGKKGLYDERAFARMIREKRFAFFLTDRPRGDPLFDARYNPVVADAMDAAYPRVTRVGLLVLHEPAD
jgi:4-amino-4-deoxy-L-arabinose transferase-like glycosyltransferase